MSGKLLILAIFFLFFGVGSVSATNLIQNGGFEKGTDGWFTFGATISQSSDYKKTDNFSGKMQTTTTNSGTKYIYYAAPVIGGKNYKASAFVIKQGEIGANLSLKFAFYQSLNGSGSQIDGVSYTSPKITQNATEFQYVETDIIPAPANAGSIRIRPSIDMPSGATQNGIAYLDEIKLEEVALNSATPIPSPTPIPNSSSTPQPTSTFTISEIPSQIDSDQSFNASVSLTLPNNRNTDYYLSGAFKWADGTRYFGLTKISSDWIKYESANYLNQYKITTDDNGIWTGTLEVKPDISDTDYKGSGDYIFKVGKYTSSGSGPNWSTESTIKIISTESSQGETLIDISSSTTNPSGSPSSVKTRITTSSQPKSYEKITYRIASVAAVSVSATPEGTVEVKNQRQINPILWVGLVFILIGVGTIGYIYLKSNAKVRIKF